MATRAKMNKIKKNGFSLVEVLIAIMLLGLVGGGFMAALANSSRYTLNADVHATAESIARSQMESIKDQDYETDFAQYDPIVVPVGWEIEIDGVQKGNGLQKIVVTVKHKDVEVLFLEGYKSG
jgi:prepilin-type N-terminal cleavage/methylation domain-containing protein